MNASYPQEAFSFIQSRYRLLEIWLGLQNCPVSYLTTMFVVNNKLLQGIFLILKT